MTDDLISRTGLLSRLRELRVVTRQEMAVYNLVVDKVKREHKITQVCGFRIDDLILIAETLRKNGIRPEDVKEARQIVELILDKAQEAMRREIERRALALESAEGKR